MIKPLFKKNELIENKKIFHDKFIIELNGLNIFNNKSVTSFQQQFKTFMFFKMAMNSCCVDLIKKYNITLTYNQANTIILIFNNPIQKLNNDNIDIFLSTIVSFVTLNFNNHLKKYYEDNEYELKYEFMFTAKFKSFNKNTNDLSEYLFNRIHVKTNHWFDKTMISSLFILTSIKNGVFIKLIDDEYRMVAMSKFNDIFNKNNKLIDFVENNKNDKVRGYIYTPDFYLTRIADDGSDIDDKIVHTHYVTFGVNIKENDEIDSELESDECNNLEYYNDEQDMEQSDEQNEVQDSEQSDEEDGKQDEEQDDKQDREQSDEQNEEQYGEHDILKRQYYDPPDMTSRQIHDMIMMDIRNKTERTNNNPNYRDFVDSIPDMTLRQIANKK
jgi:hypothetical protein